eukprot:CAMPEP_0117439994 /NCGR_PEP_ID=MMETSP0759-20121206/2848_1 /TAXON_ID=63605 /ORGANISM="Percolomonas cosmopolitus, Strain WS" /LENGTH=116 /DNA_ID=CAMNT_0005231719 /DNA_START=22 /DNA_END=372 /DNA_ORIENTATION=+
MNRNTPHQPQSTRTTPPQPHTVHQKMEEQANTVSHAFHTFDSSLLGLNSPNAHAASHNISHNYEKLLGACDQLELSVKDYLRRLCKTFIEHHDVHHQTQAMNEINMLLRSMEHSKE